MFKFKQYLLEGGNIKVGPKGQETSAAPMRITAKNRGERREDAHGALSAIHDAFHKEHGAHLFGKDKAHLKSGHIYSGSTHDFMGNHVDHGEFAKHKPHVGDIDVQVHKDHKDKLEHTLKPGRKFGKYTVVGTKKHGNEISAVMKHPSGEHHQFDFQGTHKPGSESDRFLHSSHWEDTKAGIKGAHHKILINAAGGEKHKFSITHGLRSRTDESDPGVSHPKQVAHKLFGPKADHKQIHSFKGVTQLIKKHMSPEQHQDIYNKFKDSMSRNKNVDSTHAIAHLKKHLGVQDHTNESYMTEEADTHHASVVPLMGVSPISHMGHAHDIGGKLKSLPGKRHVGLSQKADIFSPEERKKIMHKQWGHKDTKFHVVPAAGHTVRHAYDSLPKHGKKVLHILVGGDRKEFGHGLKNALHAGKIKEMGEHKWDEIHVHTPDSENRDHGMSGTKMRNAAHENDHETFKKHLGPMFKDNEAKSIMKRTQEGLKSGKIKLKR